MFTIRPARTTSFSTNDDGCTPPPKQIRIHGVISANGHFAKSWDGWEKVADTYIDVAVSGPVMRFSVQQV
jgi:hypothetical protein